MQTATRKCPLPGCMGRRTLNEVMCKRHWWQVDETLPRGFGTCP